MVSDLAEATTQPTSKVGGDEGSPGRASIVRSTIAGLRAQPLARIGGDATAVLLLVGSMWWLAPHDGGLDRRSLVTISMVAALALPAAVAEARRLPLFAQGLVAVWSLAGAMSLIMAADRSRFVSSALIYALAAIVGLCTVRILRRRWGAAVLALVLLAALGSYWSRTSLQWWGYTLSGTTPRWLSLSWHNQSSILMGSLALLSLGMALRLKGLIAWGAGACAAGGMAAMWLSGSRGGLIATTIGGLVTIAAAYRDAGARSAMLRAAAVAVGSAAMIAALLAVSPASDSPVSQSIAGRQEESGRLHAVLRVYHMEAAAGMFSDRPATGHGLGSYAAIAPRFSRLDANLTTSPHNEFAKAFAEGGVGFGGALVGMLLAGLALARRASRRAPAMRDDTDSLDRAIRRSLQTGAAGAFVALSIHAAADFDWTYPVLAALWTVSLGVLVASDRPHAGEAGRIWPSAMIALSLAALLFAGLAGAFVERAAERVGGRAAQAEFSGAPWDSGRSYLLALELARGGQVDAAADAVSRTLRWSPGDRRAQFLQSAIAFESGQMSGEELAGLLSADPREWGHTSYNVAAAALLRHSELALAEEVLVAGQDHYDAHPTWGTAALAAEAWTLLIEARGRLHGCSAARATALRAAEDELAVSGHATAPPLMELADAHCG